jgi:transposase
MAMTTMTDHTTPVTGGVDTHRDAHVAAVLDARGAELGAKSFPATESGYRQLHAWMAGFGPIERIGVEGTGTYGKGLARHLGAEGVSVIEVDRPNRQDRRRAA